MKYNSLTSIGIVTGVLVYVITVTFNIELFEIIISEMRLLEEYEVDELIVPSFIISVFFIIDQLRKQKQQQIEEEKIKIYKAMLSSTHHILNNFLNQMQLFKIKAERTSELDPKVLSMYDEVMKDASSQIDALSSVTDMNEISIKESVRPK